MALTPRTDDIFIDSFGVTIHYHRWSPKKKPTAIVQIAHGLGEHALRYENLVAALVGAGYEVWADEHRGHGATGLEQWGGDYSKLGKLGPGGMRATLTAVEDFSDLIAQQRPGVPRFFLGHSWGSVMGQMILNRGGASRYAGMILSGTAYRMPGMMNAGDLNSPFQGRKTPRLRTIHQPFYADRGTGYTCHVGFGVWMFESLETPSSVARTNAARRSSSDPCPPKWHA